MQAAADGQTIRVKYLLERLGVNIDYRDEHGFTALRHAALSGFEDTVLALLDAGANVNASSPQSGTPLCLAALKARINVCKLLLSWRSRTAGEMESGVSPLHQSALHCAALGGDVECIRLFLNHGCKVNAWCRVVDGVRGPIVDSLPRAISVVNQGPRRLNASVAFQALHLAVGNRNNYIVDCLIEAGAALNDHGPTRGSSDIAPLTPLMLAIAEGFEDIIQTLVSKRADPSFTSAPTQTPALTIAAVCGETEVIELLIENGANLDKKTDMIGTALHAAISYEKVEAALLLLRRGAAVDIADPSGNTALDLATIYEQNNVAHELARRGANFRQQDNSYVLVHLWNAYTFEHRAFGVFKHGGELPPYATLTHRWHNGEVRFEDLVRLSIDERHLAMAALKTESSNPSWTKIQNFWTQCRALNIAWT